MQLKHQGNTSVLIKNKTVKIFNKQSRKGMETRRRKMLRKRSMIFDTWNIQGLSNKTTEVLQELQHIKIYLVVLTKTKNKGGGSERDVLLQLHSQRK